MTVEELQSFSEFDHDKDGTVTQDEVQNSYMSGLESADLETFLSTVWSSIKEVYKASSDVSPPVEAPPTDEGGQQAPPSGDDDDDDDADFEEVG